jgi:gas vesicle protein
MSEENGCRMGGYLAAAVMGAAVGAGLALLFAPRSGKETRDLLTKKACDLKDKANDAVSDVREMVREKKAEITAAVEAGKQAIQDERAKHTKTV